MIDQMMNGVSSNTASLSGQVEQWSQFAAGLYKSKVYFEDENTETLSQNGYGLLNGTLGMQKKCRSFYYEVGSVARI